MQFVVTKSAEALGRSGKPKKIKLSCGETRWFPRYCTRDEGAQKNKINQFANWTNIAAGIHSTTASPCSPSPSLFLFRLLCPFFLSFLVVFRLFLVPPSSLLVSLPFFPWWRILLFSYFVPALHLPRAPCGPEVRSMRIPVACCSLHCVADADF